MPSWKKVIVSGSDASLNSLNVATNVVAQSFTGSLQGTASFASFATTASYALISTNPIVVTSPGGIYYINGVAKPVLTFVPGQNYRFDTSNVDSPHPFKFSLTPNGPTQYTYGVTSGSGFIEINVDYATSQSLYYYCTIHSGMGNEANTLRQENLVATATFNAFSASINSYTSSTNIFTGSIQTQVNNLQAATSSYVTNSQTSSMSVASASFAQTAVSASFASTASSADNFTVRNTITAQTLIVQTITSSIVYSSGSNIFGNDLSNTQILTGSVSVTGSLAVNNSNVILSNQTSSMSVATASFAQTASYVTLAQTASYVQNAQTASFVLNHYCFVYNWIKRIRSIWIK